MNFINLFYQVYKVSSNVSSFMLYFSNLNLLSLFLFLAKNLSTCWSFQRVNFGFCWFSLHFFHSILFHLSLLQSYFLPSFCFGLLFSRWKGRLLIYNFLSNVGIQSYKLHLSTTSLHLINFSIFIFIHLKDFLVHLVVSPFTNWWFRSEFFLISTYLWIS